jgi:diguanylate cyclase (GGDEF)-like protein
VINVESPAPIGDDVPDELERLAGLLSVRITDLGGPPGESRAQRLARHATGLAGLVDRDAIEQRVVAAACDIVDMGSGMLAMVGPTGGLELRAARGPLAEAFAAMGPDQLDAIRSWTGSMTSCYTIGEPGGRGFTGHEPLRAAGAEAIVALPLGSDTAFTGMLLLADPVPIMLATEDVELLELLCAQATSALGTATAVAELRDRATRDALTGLRNHAMFHSDLDVALQRGETLSVLIVDIDGFKAYNDSGGHQRGDDALRSVASAVALAIGDHGSLYRVGGDEFAAILWAAESGQAAAIAETAITSVRLRRLPTVSAGVAVARLGESAHTVVARADSALYAAKHGGRDRLMVADD